MLPYLTTVLQRSWRMFYTVTKIMLPVMVIVRLAQELGLVEQVGYVIAPAMALLNLPPEAGIIWATTLLTGLYGGIATLSSLASTISLTSGQLSALCAMMLFTHALPVEQSVVRRAGASFSITAALRIGVALTYGAAVSWASHLTGLLNDPVSFDWLRGTSDNATQTGLLAWLQATLFSLGLTLAIIVILVVALDGLDRLGITKRFTTAMMPLLRLSGLEAKVAPVTTVGVLLGLTYGGALIIEESSKQNFSARTRFLALSWLSLSHALIEDTLLMMALGADVWVILVGRLLLTMCIIAILAKLTNRGTWLVATRN
ncbi:hypothetical protein H0A58_06120 [Alcaligenaceae bacterium]|nr:hypothetical protein [Alcaligenaceae bacterium]